MKVTFNEENHIYTMDGSPILSVTQYMSKVGCINPETNKWQSISGAEFFSKDDTSGAEFGTEVHSLAKYHILGVECDYDPLLEPYLNGLKMFLSDNDLKPILDDSGVPILERPIASKMYRYGMTPDFPCIDSKGKYWIVDWKTGGMAKHYWLQQGAYAHGVKEYYGIKKPIGSWIVQLKPNCYSSEKRSPAETNYNFNKFLSIINTYKIGVGR